MTEALFVVGRERELKVYKKFLAGETPWVFIITGLGGIGKTTFLDRLARYTNSISRLSRIGVVTLDFANEDLRNDPLKLLKELTADTVPFCDLQQVDSAFKEVLQQNIDQLAQLSMESSQTGVSESEDLAMREIRHQMRELATEAFYTQIKAFRLNQLLLMLDTCEWLNEPEGIEVGQWVLNELVPGLHTRIRQQGRQCHVVMASRVQFKLDVINGRDQQRIALPMLGKAEVDQYLEYWGMQDADLCQRIFEVTHGHALCVSIICDFWKQREKQKEPFTIEDLPEFPLQEFSEKALMQFTNERVLKQLKSPFKELTHYGVLLRSFDLPLLRDVFPELLPEAAALETFNQLIRYPYIESRGNYRYAFHELLRQALPEVTQREELEEWRDYHKRALEYLTKVSSHSPDWYYHLLAYDEKKGLIEWQQAIKEARKSGKRESIGALLQAALDEALNLSPAARAQISFEQGRFNYYGGQLEEALKSYNNALDFFQKVNDYSGQAKVLQALGDVQRTLNRQDDALRCHEQALTYFRLIGDQSGEARSCQAMGDVQQIRKDLDAALHCYEQCLDLFKQLKDKSEEAKALEAMGDVQRRRNDLDAALRMYEQALALYQEEKDRLKRAKVLKSIGHVQRLRQGTNAAQESYVQALALFGELKEPEEEANIRDTLEEIKKGRNIYRTVIISSTESRFGTSRVLTLPNGEQVPLIISRGAYHGQILSLGDNSSPVTYDGEMGALILVIAVIPATSDDQQLSHLPDEVLRNYEQALAMYLEKDEEKDSLKRAKVLKAMGDLQRLLKQLDAAQESYGQALAIFGELEELAEVANIRRTLEEIIESRNIYQTVIISSLESCFGTSRMLTLPNGEQVTLSIPPGAYHGQVIHLEYKAGAAMYDGEMGALILIIAVIP